MLVYLVPIIYVVNDTLGSVMDWVVSWIFDYTFMCSAGGPLAKNFSI